MNISQIHSGEAFVVTDDADGVIYTMRNDGSIIGDKDGISSLPISPLDFADAELRVVAQSS